jgi:hypothetical protein
VTAGSADLSPTLGPMRVAFLLGSGISVDADMPDAKKISAQVFSGKGVVRHSDATYYVAGENTPRWPTRL